MEDSYSINLPCFSYSRSSAGRTSSQTVVHFLDLQLLLFLCLMNVSLLESNRKSFETLSVARPLPSYPVPKLSPWCKMSCPPSSVLSCPQTQSVVQDVLPSLLNPILSSNSVRVARYPALLAQSYPVLKISPSGKMSCPPCSVLSCPQTRSAVQDVQPSLLNR